MLSKLQLLLGLACLAPALGQGIFANLALTYVRPLPYQPPQLNYTNLTESIYLNGSNYEPSYNSSNVEPPPLQQLPLPVSNETQPEIPAAKPEVPEIKPQVSVTNETKPEVPAVNATKPEAPGTNVTKPEVPATNETKSGGPATNETKPNKTDPGVNTFANVFPTPSFTCKLSMNILSYLFPSMEKCFASTSLYFSTLTTVCSPECLTPTIRSSQLISHFCLKSIKDQGVETNSTDPEYIKYDAYRLWASKDLAELSCAYTPVSNQTDLKPNSTLPSTNITGITLNQTNPDTQERCIQRLDKSSIAVSNYKALYPSETSPQDQKEIQTLKDTICHPCLEKMRSFIPNNVTSESSLNPTRIFPSVYLFNLEGYPKVFKMYDSLCLNKTTYNSTK